MRRSSDPISLTLFLIAASLTVAARGSSSTSDQASPPSRTFAFTYQVHLPATKDASGKMLLWLPLPPQDVYQKIQDLQVESPVLQTRGQEPEYGNSYVLLEPTPAQRESGFDATIRFVAVRYEHKVSLDSPSVRRVGADSASAPDLQRYLEPDKLVPLDGIISDLAREHTAGDSDPIVKARHIYDYVLSTMRYDKTGEGWGRGDAVWACTSKRGNCTDFHSLFIGMMRATGIPARFEIGFPVPESKTEADIPGYHCWAEFYLDGVGWVPVDASEASKNPAKRDYFFGAHDVNRIFFTYGRDLRLSPAQQGAALNYFIYPYAELDGKPFAGLETHYSFRDDSAPRTPAPR